MNDTIQAKLDQAIHTAVSELPKGTHIDDLVDCVAVQMTNAEWDQVHVGYVYKRIQALS